MMGKNDTERERETARKGKKGVLLTARSAVTYMASAVSKCEC